MARFCGQCGGSNAIDVAYCTGCGARLDDNRAQALHEQLEQLRATPDAAAALQLGHLYLAERQQDEAMSAFQLALEAAPDLAPAHLALAVVYLQREAADAARPHLEAAIRHGDDPRLIASARAYLAMLLIEEFDIRGANEQLTQAEGEDAQSFLVLWKRGEYYFRLGMYYDAVRVLTAAGKLAPPSRSSGMYVARLLELSQERAKQAIRREPLFPRWMRQLRQRTIKLNEKEEPAL